MRSRLSYYSVVLLVGLAILSGLIFVINPFNGAPASASPATQGATAGGEANATSSSVSTTTFISTQGGNGFGSGLQSGGTSGGEHHHHSDFPGLGGVTRNGTITTTTTTGVIHSQGE